MVDTEWAGAFNAESVVQPRCSRRIIVLLKMVPDSSSMKRRFSSVVLGHQDRNTSSSSVFRHQNDDFTLTVPILLALASVASPLGAECASCEGCVTDGRAVRLMLTRVDQFSQHPVAIGESPEPFVVIARSA